MTPAATRRWRTVEQVSGRTVDCFENEYLEPRDATEDCADASEVALVRLGYRIEPVEPLDTPP